MIRRPSFALPLLLAALLAPSSKPVAGAGAGPEPPPEANLAAVIADWAAWERAAAELQEAIDRFAAQRSSPWAGPADLLGALRAKDDVHRLAGLVDGYLSLRLSFDSSDAEAVSRRPTMDKLSAAWDGDASAWFEPRLRTLGAQRIESWLAADSRLRPYRWMLRRATRRPPHELAASEQPLAAEIAAERETARRVHSSLHVAEAPRVELALPSGRQLQIGPALGRNLCAEIADPADRRAARRAWLTALAGRAETTAALFAGLVRRERTDSELRGYSSALAASFADEGVPESVVLGMVDAARAGAPAVARWHAARNRRLRLAPYGPCDVRTPLTAAAAPLEWAEARGSVLASAAPLGEPVVAILRRAFEERWIDAVERPRKQVVGFSTFVYGDRPFVSVVYRGTTLDLVRLTHELGHAVHHRLAFESQPFGPSRPSVLVGETVAAVHEALLARWLSRAAAGGPERAAALDLEAQLAHRSFVATALDADFEIAAHRESAALSAARLAEMYRERLEAFHGGALALDEAEAHGWLETPHFFSAPFTMGRYGLSFAAAMKIAEGLLAADPAVAAAARERYLALLRAGGSDAPLALLAAAGADLEDPSTIAAVPRRLAEVAAALEGLD